MLAAALMLVAPLAAISAEEPEAATTTEETSETAEGVDESLKELEEVIVYGTNGQLVAGLQAESEFDEATIATYGANTVGDLISQVAPEVDSSEEGPVILINGKPANGIRSVNDLPPESVARLQVLPPQAAGAIGESPTRRVLNVVLKPQFRQGTGNVTARGATAGKGFGADGNVSRVRLEGNNITQLSVNASRTNALLEADRGIVTQSSVVPYDLVGNVVSWPLAGSEIDPDLSALAGQPVNALGLPAGLADPSLGDLAPFANLANASDMGRYRTLVAEQNNLGINGNKGFQLPWRNASLNLNFNLNRNESHSLSGATTSLLHLPESSSWSPFSRDVGIARYLGEPLSQESARTNGNLSANLSSQLGRWRLNLDTNISMNRSTTVSERRVDTTELQAAIDAGLLNPFDALPADMLDETLEDRARSRGRNLSLNMNLSGSLFDMPAGKASGNLRASWSENQQRSSTVGTNNVNRRSTQENRAATFTMQLPLLGTPQSQGMGMGGELSTTARHVIGSGTLFNYGTGLNWRMGSRINLRVGYNREKVAPNPSVLTDPVITVDDVRTYDFLRQETVLVRYITGGNPDIGNEERDIVRLSGQTRPFKAIDFTLTAEYQRMVGHDVMASLPPPSEEVQAAFPDRYRRDLDGRLYEIDARMVSFDRSQTESLRWGGNFRRTFGLPPARTPGNPGQIMAAGGIVSIPPGTIITSSGGAIIMSDGADESAGPGWRLTSSFSHNLQLSNTRRARAGLPTTDLLAGGTSSGSGQSRHTVQARVSMAHNGSGLSLNTNWKSRTHIIAGTSGATNDIVFSDFLRFDLQAFSNLGSLLPAQPMAKGVRISLNVENLFDAQQRVTDENGITPLRYQPYLLNPLGRMLSLSFRKSF